MREDFGNEQPFLYEKLKQLESLKEEIYKIIVMESKLIEEANYKVNKNKKERVSDMVIENICEEQESSVNFEKTIKVAEEELAKGCEILMQTDKGGMRLENIFIMQGMRTGEGVINGGEKINSAIEIYEALKKYTLEEVPLYQAKGVINFTPLKVSWSKRNNRYKELWRGVNIKEESYYELIDLWTKAFVTELNSNFHFAEQEDGTRVIENSMTSEDMQVYQLDI